MGIMDMCVQILNSEPPVMVLHMSYFHLIQRWVQLGDSLMSGLVNRVPQKRRKSPAKGDDTMPAGPSTQGIDLPLLQHESHPCEQIAVPLWVSNSAFKSLFAFWYL